MKRTWQQDPEESGQVKQKGLSKKAWKGGGDSLSWKTGPDKCSTNNSNIVYLGVLKHIYVPTLSLVPS